MSFNEEQFRQLVDETEKIIIALGTTAQAVLDRHRRFMEQLAGFLREMDCGFDLQLCLSCMTLPTGSALSIRRNTVPG